MDEDLIASPKLLMGVAASGFALWLIYAAAHRSALRLFADPRSTDRWLHRLPQTLLLCALMIVWSVAGLGFTGWLSGGTVLAVAACFFFASRAIRPTELPSIRVPSKRQDHTRRWPGLVRWPITLTSLVVSGDLLAHLPMPPIDWDAITYHLYLPARWLQEGQIVHVPTVFSDNAAAFAPQNGALFFAWQMALLGYDALINVSQLVCLVFLGLALYHLCRLLAVDRASAALAALTLPWLAPIRRWTYSANVDLFMIAFAFGGLLWGLRYLERPSTPTAVASGLATGLAAGTKTLGLPLVSMQAIPFIWAALRARRFADLAWFTGGAIGAGGWWYLLNLWRYGNPLFPVQIALPVFGELPGAYGAAALRAGEFHLDGLRAVGVSVRDQWGLTTCLLMTLGLVALIRRARRDIFRRSSKPHARILLVLAIAWWTFFVTVVPHNNQARFALPALVISLVGWSLILQQARRSGPKAAFGVWSLGITAAALASQPWTDWIGSLTTLTRATTEAPFWATTEAPFWATTTWIILCGLTLATAAVISIAREWQPPRIVAAGLALITTLLAVVLSQTSRPAFFALADYRGWSDGYLAFNQPEAPPTRIAYTGANVPYALMGGDRRHRVVYLNTQGESDDGFYNFWQRDPQTYPYHKPGIYRGDDNVELWLARIVQQDIDTVVIFALHPAERRYLSSTPDGFPIERDWVKNRNDLFRPVSISRAAEIYRVGDLPDP